MILKFIFSNIISIAINFGDLRKQEPTLFLVSKDSTQAVLLQVKEEVENQES